MPSRAHQEYQANLALWIMEHGREPGVADEFELYRGAILVLWHKTSISSRPGPLSPPATHPAPAEETPGTPSSCSDSSCSRCSSASPASNKWVPHCRASRLLPVLAGADLVARLLAGEEVAAAA